MRIVFLTSSLSAGGAERVASTLVNAWNDRGDTVTIIPTFSGGGEPFYALNENVELVYLASLVSGNGKSLSGYIKRLLALRGLLIARKPDVVVSFLPNVNVAVIIALFFCQIPLVICERSDPSCIPIPPVWRLAIRIFYRFADVLTVQTLAVAEKARTMFPGVKKIITIANPLPDGVVKTKLANADNVRRVLLSLGRLSEEKQIHFVIDVFARLHEKFPDWDLHIVGDGSTRPYLEQQVQALGLQDRILFKGKTSEPWQVMSQADVFVMTSQFEGFPNALMEAMGIGLPCVTFDTPSGPRELSENGECALLVPFNDSEGLVSALQALFADAELRKKLGEKAKASVLGRYRLPVVLAQWDKLFAEIGVDVSNVRS